MVGLRWRPKHFDGFFVLLGEIRADLHARVQQVCEYPNKAPPPATPKEIRLVVGFGNPVNVAAVFNIASRHHHVSTWGKLDSYYEGGGRSWLVLPSTFPTLL